MDSEDIRTIWCGNLHDKVTEDILYELFMQGGPVQKISIPKDRDGKQKSFGFVTYKHVCSVPYALDLFDGTALFNRALNMKSRTNSMDRNNLMENSYRNYQNQQQLQQIQHQIQQQSGNMFDNRQHNIQNELQLGQQILLGAVAPMSFGNSMYNMIPGSVAYPSQTSLYSQSPQNSSDHKRSGRKHNRNTPYQDREQYNDRHSNRQESFNRDHKSYKSSSHRSNRHDSRRKYH